MFDMVWSGRRHVMMGASQIDRFGNQNFAFVGPWEQPKAQLLGFRGAPGNTIQNTTSYWIPNHSPKVFVPKVDVVSGVGYDRAAALGPQASRFHEIRRVVTNLGVLDFETPDHAMRLRSVHPGVTVDEIVAATGFDLVVPDDVADDPRSRPPTSSRSSSEIDRPARPPGAGSPDPVTHRRPVAADAGVRAVRRRVPDRADGHGLGRGRAAHRGDERGGRARHPRVGDDDARRAAHRDPRGEGPHRQPVRREPPLRPARRRTSASA